MSVCGMGDPPGGTVPPWEDENRICSPSGESAKSHDALPAGSLTSVLAVVVEQSFGASL